MKLGVQINHLLGPGTVIFIRLLVKGWNEGGISASSHRHSNLGPGRQAEGEQTHPSQAGLNERLADKTCQRVPMRALHERQKMVILFQATVIHFIV